jgi:hypothetical protein
MKKVLIIVLLLIAMNVWSQSSWIYDRQWSGITEYEGSGRVIFDDHADINNNWSGGRMQRIERPSNEQMNVIKYGLRQYTVRINDVYIIFFGNDISKRRYVALVIITAFTSGGGYNFSYFLWEDLAYRRN